MIKESEMNETDDVELRPDQPPSKEIKPTQTI